MGNVSKTASVSYTAEQMYGLVNDIESYPEFLPWCTDAVIFSQTDSELTASVSLATGKLKQTFTTKNKMEPGHRIDINLISGPFKYLRGFWQFDDVRDGVCHVELYMEFEFKNKVLKIMLSSVFTQFMNSLVSSFIKRARQIYD